MLRLLAQARGPGVAAVGEAVSNAADKWGFVPS